MRRYFQTLMTVAVDTHDPEPAAYDLAEVREAAQGAVLVDLDDDGQSRFVGPAELKHVLAGVEFDWEGLKEVAPADPTV